LEQTWSEYELSPRSYDASDGSLEDYLGDYAEFYPEYRTIIENLSDLVSVEFFRYRNIGNISSDPVEVEAFKSFDWPVEYRIPLTERAVEKADPYEGNRFEVDILPR